MRGRMEIHIFQNLYQHSEKSLCFRCTRNTDTASERNFRQSEARRTRHKRPNLLLSVVPYTRNPYSMHSQYAKSSPQTFFSHQSIPLSREVKEGNKHHVLFPKENRNPIISSPKRKPDAIINCSTSTNSSSAPAP